VDSRKRLQQQASGHPPTSGANVHGVGAWHRWWVTVARGCPLRAQSLSQEAQGSLNVNVIHTVASAEHIHIARIPVLH
jgi:hypothetical protein